MAKHPEVLSICMSSPVTFSKVGNVLYFKGTGLNPGVWTGIDGHTTEYDAGLIQLNAAKFAMKKMKTIKTEHEQGAKDVVGWSTGFAPNVEGGVDIEGYVFDPDEIFTLETLAAAGQPIGISPELKAPSEWDEALGYWKAQDLDVVAFDFVPNPACKTCFVDHTELKNLSGGPVGGIPNQIAAHLDISNLNLGDVDIAEVAKLVNEEIQRQLLAGKKLGQEGENGMSGETGGPKTFSEALTAFTDCPNLTDTEKALYEYNTFLSASMEEGKSLEESIAAYRTLQEKKDDDVCPVCKKDPCVCEKEKKKLADEKEKNIADEVPKMDEATQNKLLAAAATVTSFAESQRLTTLSEIEAVTTEIAVIDQTFDATRFLAALGDGNEATKLALLNQYHNTIKHYKETLPEERRQLSGPEYASNLDAVAKKFYGVEKYDIDAISKKMFAE